ncbi:MAG TPA: hypothetical protein VFL91_12400 [Thermomicrobiales bacterium]|nr:hypothetical protein [Thermomicrobiales bacterium]
MDSKERAGPAAPLRQARRLLRVAFVVLPLLAGLDKLQERLTGTHLIADWHQYLAPLIPRLLGVDKHTIMFAVGILEVVAALLVAFRPAIGGYVVAAWLWGIIIDLLLVPGFYDIVLRDFGLSLGALALARLSQAGAARAADRP